MYTLKYEPTDKSITPEIVGKSLVQSINAYFRSATTSFPQCYIDSGVIALRGNLNDIYVGCVYALRNIMSHGINVSIKQEFIPTPDRVLDKSALDRIVELYLRTQK